MTPSAKIEESGSKARSRGLQAARRLEASLGLVRRARAHLGRRPPSGSGRKHHRRARRQLAKLTDVLAALQREVLEQGVSSSHLEQLTGVLDPLDAVLAATRESESRTRAFKRVRKAARTARHALTD
ncbi:MAG: hypothetical protein AAF602_13525 [Myxococcota bacterium]